MYCNAHDQAKYQGQAIAPAAGSFDLERVVVSAQP